MAKGLRAWLWTCSAASALVLARTPALAQALEAGPPMPAPTTSALIEAAANHLWHAPVGAPEAIWVGDEQHAEPVLALPKSVLNGGPVTLRLTSDARQLQITSGKGSLTIDLSADQGSRLLLDASALAPTLRLDDRELAPLRGKWVQVALRDPDPTLTLRFVGGTYANVRLPARAASGLASAPAAVAAPVVVVEAPDAAAAPHMVVAPPAEATDAPAVATTPTPDTGSAASSRTQIQPVGSPRYVGPIPGQHTQPNELGTDNSLRLTLDAGFDFLSSYNYRGLGRQNEDMIAQPWFDLGLTVWRDDEGAFPVLNQVDLVAGLRNTHAGGDSTWKLGQDENWVELDWYGGVKFRGLERFTLGIFYENVESIRTSFRDVHQFNFLLAYDDSDPNYQWSLQPYVLISAEYEKQSDAGYLTVANVNNPLFDTGFYMELGVAPSFDLFSIVLNEPATLTVPAKVGLSLGDYYESPVNGNDDFFGYFQTGLELAVPFAKLPAGVDRRILWQLDLGFYFMVVGESVQEFNQAIGVSDNEFQLVGKAGLSVHY